jgi:hypothetical protein
MLAVPDAAMKIAAAELENSSGQRKARVQGLGMGLAPTQWSGIKNPSSPATASAGSLFTD